MGGISKFLSEKLGALRDALGLQNNSFVALVAEDKLSLAQKRAGVLRTMLGTGLDLLEKDVFRFCWIVDFPMYEIGEESGALEFCHNPFSIILKSFSLVGLDKSVVEIKFPELYHAFEYGAPPHAGVAPGVDRMVMLICDTVNIREVIAFPMNKNARDLMMNAPAPVEQKQLDEVHIALDLKKRGEK